MSSWFAEAAVVEPVRRPRVQAKPRPKTKAKAKQRRRARSGVLWIAVSGVLLGGVVFVNVAVLRLNLELDKATQERAQLHAEDASLQSRLSSALASPRIQRQAQQEEGLVQADPSTIGFIKLNH